MGKGDRKTRRGKIKFGSYGIKRPRKKANKAAAKSQETIVKEKENKVISPIKESKEVKKVEAVAPKASKEVKKVEAVAPKATKEEKKTDTAKEAKTAKTIKLEKKPSVQKTSTPAKKASDTTSKKTTEK